MIETHPEQPVAEGDDLGHFEACNITGVSPIHRSPPYLQRRGQRPRLQLK